MIWPEVPVLLLSTDLTDLPITLKRQGASALVHKPFEPQELLEVLQAAMSPAYAAYRADHLTSEAS